MKAQRFFAYALLAGGMTAAALAQSSPQPQDEDFAKLVKEWTTMPEFLSPLVDHLP